MADGIGTRCRLRRRSGTTTYGENIGVMVSTKVDRFYRLLACGGVRLDFEPVPKFGAAINTILPARRRRDTCVAAVGMIGVRIWADNHVTLTSRSTRPRSSR